MFLCSLRKMALKGNCSVHVGFQSTSLNKGTFCTSEGCRLKGLNRLLGYSETNDCVAQKACVDQLW